MDGMGKNHRITPSRRGETFFALFLPDNTHDRIFTLTETHCLNPDVEDSREIRLNVAGVCLACLEHDGAVTTCLRQEFRARKTGVYCT